MSNPKDWLEIADNVFNRAIGFGIVLFILSSTFWITYRAGLITPSPTTALVYDICQVVSVLSLALFVLGLFIRIAGAVYYVIRSPFEFISNVAANRTNRAKLTQNFSLLTRESQVIFHQFLQEPDGRFRSPGNTPYVRELMELGLIRPEDGGNHGFSHKGELMIVVPLLYNDRTRETVSGYLTAQGIPIDDPQKYSELLRRIALTNRLRA